MLVMIDMTSSTRRERTPYFGMTKPMINSKRSISVGLTSQQNMNFLYKRNHCYTCKNPSSSVSGKISVESKRILGNLLLSKQVT